MAINSLSSPKTAPAMASSAISPTDTEAKNIRNQIANKQQSLNRLSSDSEMTAEEKVKERQEIQTQIAELNRKLRMLQMEKEEKAREAEKDREQKAAISENQNKELPQNASDKTTSDKKADEPSPKVNISPQNIQKILEVGSLIQKERIQQNVSTKKEATESILKAEIKSDELYGSDTSVKREKLSSSMRKETFELLIEEHSPKQEFPGKASSAKIIFSEDRL